MPTNTNPPSRGSNRMRWPMIVLVLGIIACFALLIWSKTRTKTPDTTPDATTPAAQTQKPNEPSVPPEETENPGEYRLPDSFYTDQDVFGVEHNIEKNNNADKVLSAGTYRNDGIYQCRINDYVTFCVGTNQSIVTDGICLNPTVQSVLDPNNETSYGFFVRPSRGEILYKGTPQEQWREQNQSYRYFLMPCRTYDRLVPAEYISAEQPGVQWVNDFSGDGLDKTGATLHLYAVRLGEGTLAGVVEVEIQYLSEESCYRIVRMENADLVSQGLYTSDDRMLLAEAGAQFTRQATRFEITSDELEAAKGTMIWEHCGWPLFPRFYNTEMVLAPAGRYSGCDIYALHIPHKSYGYITLYFAERTSAVRAESFGDVELSDGNHYVLIGRETVKPFTVEEFKSTIQPSEYKFFDLD